MCWTRSDCSVTLPWLCGEQTVGYPQIVAVLSHTRTIRRQCDRSHCAAIHHGILGSRFASKQRNGDFSRLHHADLPPPRISVNLCFRNFSRTKWRWPFSVLFAPRHWKNATRDNRLNGFGFYFHFNPVTRCLCLCLTPAWYSSRSVFIELPRINASLLVTLLFDAKKYIEHIRLSLSIDLFVVGDRLCIYSFTWTRDICLQSIDK